MSTVSFSWFEGDRLDFEFEPNLAAPLWIKWHTDEPNIHPSDIAEGLDVGVLTYAEIRELVTYLQTVLAEEPK